MLATPAYDPNRTVQGAFQRVLKLDLDDIVLHLRVNKSWKLDFVGLAAGGHDHLILDLVVAAGFATGWDLLLMVIFLVCEWSRLTAFIRDH